MRVLKSKDIAVPLVPKVVSSLHVVRPARRVLVGLTAAGHFADVRKWRVGVVNQLMLLQVRRACEFAATVLASIWPRSSVHPHVADESLDFQRKLMEHCEH